MVSDFITTLREGGKRKRLKKERLKNKLGALTLEEDEMGEAEKKKIADEERKKKEEDKKKSEAAKGSCRQRLLLLPVYTPTDRSVAHYRCICRTREEVRIIIDGHPNGHFDAQGQDTPSPGD